MPFQCAMSFAGTPALANEPTAISSPRYDDRSYTVPSVPVPRACHAEPPGGQNATRLTVVPPAVVKAPPMQMPSWMTMLQMFELPDGLLTPPWKAWNELPFQPAKLLQVTPLISRKPPPMSSSPANTSRS
ncbi:MAG: hypothetical protein IPH48_16460 [bacterium]|nr:hypothetical protein [bacterium]